VLPAPRVPDGLTICRFAEEVADTKGAEMIMPDNGMAEAFVKTLKRDYARVSPCPDAASVLRQLDGWFEHYNPASQHPSVYAVEENRSA
jgi:hypothetical protein